MYDDNTAVFVLTVSQLIYNSIPGNGGISRLLIYIPLIFCQRVHEAPHSLLVGLSPPNHRVWLLQRCDITAPDDCK